MKWNNEKWRRRNNVSGNESRKMKVKYEEISIEKNVKKTIKSEKEEDEEETVIEEERTKENNEKKWKK